MLLGNDAGAFLGPSRLPATCARDGDRLQKFPRTKTLLLTLPLPTVTSGPPEGHYATSAPLQASLGGLLIVTTQ